MKTALTIREIRENFTDEAIRDIFELNGMFISTINEKGDINNGMTFAMNKEDDVFYFHSFAVAYRHFLKMNWF